MMKNLKINNLINKILIIFLLIQPIFDLKFFYNSISTLIRVIIILALFVYYFFTSKEKTKYWLFLYPLTIGIYFIFHHLNALHFTSLVPGDFNYSVFKEALYFVKMLSPFLLIYCIYKSSMSSDKILSIIKSLTLTISLIYALGIIGIILVFAPYFIIIGVFAYDTIKKKFKNLTVQNLLAGITIVFLFGISYMSGNLLNSLSFTIYFALPFVILQKR